jgi:gas vesicle protein
MSRRPHPSPCCLLPALAVAVLAWSAAGCAPAAKPKEQPTEQPKAAAGGHDHDHDHGDHDHPETIAAGVAELESTAKDIATKLAAGSQEAADDALHAAGHLLEDLQGLLAKEKDLSAEAKDAGKKSLDELFECFDKLDTAMHAGADEAKTTVADVHASVKDRIEAAVKSLKETFSKEAK